MSKTTPGGQAPASPPEAEAPKRYMCYVTNSSGMLLEVRVQRPAANGGLEDATVYVQPGGRPKVGEGARVHPADLAKYSPHLVEHQVEMKE